METKRYFANTVEEALALARKDFGDEALLVESKRTQAGEARLGAYEVVVAAPEPEAAPAASAPEARNDAALEGLVRSEISSLRSELERMAGLLAHVLAGAMAARLPALAPLTAELERADLAQRHIQELTTQLGAHAEDPATAGETVLRASLHRLLAGRLRCDARPPAGGPSPRILALAGPPGAGKTTTLVKLAIREGLEKGLATALITTDTVRIAAVDQLKAYAAILGVPCTVLEHGGGLAGAIEEFRGKDLILIDTPGFSHAEWDLATEWAHYLTAQPGMETHLVLSATTRSADVERLLGQWGIFAPQRLLFTHLDETAATGGILTAALDSGLPVSFLATGQTIPEDLEPAGPARLLAFLETRARARRATSSGRY